jgi:DNA polymerase-3 subunit alpha/error-prone DNA polymerase
MALAGFDDAAADGLRKIMSKKDREHQLQDYYVRFAEGAARRGVTPAQIQAVWEMMLSFSGYSFCKPHSASYARVSFQAAYLKTHFPAEFMAAVISNQGGFYSTFAYVSEARRLGLTVAGPDVNRSDVRWHGRGRRLRAGLMAVKGLGAETAARIVAQAPFGSVDDFLNRVRPAEDETRALIQCGALDSLHPDLSRGQRLWLAARHQAMRRDRPRERPLFDDPALPETPPPLPPDNPTERLRREFRVLGFLCDRHPMTLFADAARKARAVKARDIARHLGADIALAGWLITGKVVHTKHGDPMEFLTFEDDSGIVETTFFPDAYERFCHLIDHGRPYLLRGRVEENWGALTLTVSHVRPLAEAA